MLILATRADGEYAADTIVISIPRQVGKTYLIGCIIFALCLMKPGLRVIWTAQVKDTALETFDKFLTMAAKPSVRPHIEATPRGKGDESVIFKNGSTIEFGARDSGFGRGRTDVDVLVFDEGQHLSTEALENMGAAQNVAVNPLTFVMGTPPRPRDKGEFFSLLRREALDGDSDGTLYIETSADLKCDPMDRAQWRKANPSFPARTSERAMLRLRKKLKNPDSWAREALGIWDDGPGRKIPSTVWLDARDLMSVAVEDFAVGVQVADDMSVCSVAVAGRRSDGDWHVHLEERFDVIAEAVPWVSAFVRANPIRAVVADMGSPTSVLADSLKRAKVAVTELPVRQLGVACASHLEGLRQGTVHHIGQAQVDAAVLITGSRSLGKTGMWVYTSPEGTEVTAVQAQAWALWGAQNSTVKRPARRSGGRRVVTA